jgi:hypothetical protein
LLSRVASVVQAQWRSTTTDDEGRTYAELALRVRDLLVLHHRPIAAA